MQNIFSVKKNTAKTVAGILILVVALFSTTLPFATKALADDYSDNGDWGTTYNDSTDWGTTYNDSTDWGTTYNDNTDWGTTYNDSTDWGTTYNDNTDYGTTYNDNTDCTDCNSTYYDNNYDNGCSYGCNTGYYNNYDTGCSYGCNYNPGCSYNCYPPPPPPRPTPHPTPHPTPVPAQLSVYCVASDTNINVGDSVTWRANVSGGIGNYSYNWSGDASGSGSNVSRTYNSSGTKRATVEVRSGNQVETASCTTFVQEEQNNLDAYCEASPNNVDRDETVTWRVFPSGGTGSYSYDWSGAVSGSSRTEQESYSSSGTKRATVEVRSGNQTITRNCSATVDRNNNRDLSFTCEADRHNARVGDVVYWSSDVSGGDGDYTYSWRTSDNIGSKTNESLRTRYDSTGTKRVSLTVRSNGDSQTEDCGSVFITGTLGTSVTVTTLPPAAPLSSAVYLSQVPYTGLELSWKLVGFVGALILWSAWIAYFIFRKKVLRDMAKNSALVSSLEEEARKENVVVSQDAIASIMKKAKAEKAIASEVLKRVIAKAKLVSGNDSWIALSKEKINNI
ncbi:MAG: PKD domain-containing protein [Candidatus Pacebacteria bacterium]|nr:PKD domain-containing protein [Candidatus Paceibacterota bacterium]